MNVRQYFSGCLKALGFDTDWPEYFDLSERGFRLSFLTIPLSLPFYYMCALAIHKQQVTVLEQTPNYEGGTPELISPLLFVLISLAFGFSFSLIAFLLAGAFNKTSRFKSWAIVRHWSFFFVALIAAAFLGLTYFGIAPFSIILPLIFCLYLGTLAIDIRLAQKIGGFEWGGAILTGCIITALGLSVILMGLTRLA